MKLVTLEWNGKPRTRNRSSAWPRASSNSIAWSMAWSEEDAAKAEAYRACADVVIWTPGVTSGNPISLNLLPDFAAIGDKQDRETEDERTQAVEMARATLGPYHCPTLSFGGNLGGIDLVVYTQLVLFERVPRCE